MHANASCGPPGNPTPLRARQCAPQYGAAIYLPPAPKPPLAGGAPKPPLAGGALKPQGGTMRSSRPSPNAYPLASEMHPTASLLTVDVWNSPCWAPDTTCGGGAAAAKRWTTPRSGQRRLAGPEEGSGCCGWRGGAPTDGCRGVRGYHA